MRRKSLTEKFKLLINKGNIDKVVYSYSIDRNILYIDLYMISKTGKISYLTSLGEWQENKMKLLEEEGITSIVDAEEQMKLRLKNR